METIKKIRAKIPKETKIRAELQKEINSICPFCNNTDVGHFQIHHIDENPSNNEKGNLLLLCCNCHSKITKGDISKEEVLRKKIDLLTKPLVKTNSPKIINFNEFVGHAITGDNPKITFNEGKKVVKKEKYPEGCIGHDTTKANYVSHLIQRFNDYKENEVGKENMVYGWFGAHLKKKYKIGTSRTIYNVPIEKFEELCLYIQTRIDGTMFAKRQGKQHKNYSTFDEYTK